MVGAKLVFPGPWLDGRSLHELFEDESVTLSAGVPTVWKGLLAHVEANGLGFRTMRRTVIGGSACPPAMMAAFQDRYDVQVLHAWGMTETSPLGTVCSLKPAQLALAPEQRLALQAKQGRAVFGVDMKIVDDGGDELPQDGKTSGELMVRGPWIVSDYFKSSGPSPLLDGWFPTGDVATIDPDGFMQITDRSKDLIKSGGEWIGSIELESVALAHPAVAMAACIAARPPEVGRAARCWWWSRYRAPSSPASRCCATTRARSPSGGSPTTSCSSTPSRSARPARSRRTCCGSASRTTSSRRP
jgi:fatty-acyl-CoA synthase